MLQIAYLALLEDEYSGLTMTCGRGVRTVKVRLAACTLQPLCTAFGTSIARNQSAKEAGLSNFSARKTRFVVSFAVALAPSLYREETLD